MGIVTCLTPRLSSSAARQTFRSQSRKRLLIGYQYFELKSTAVPLGRLVHPDLLTTSAPETLRQIFIGTWAIKILLSSQSLEATAQGNSAIPIWVAMDFLVKFAQVHESFRLAELKALATLEGIDLVIKDYDPDVGTFLLALKCSKHLTLSSLHCV